MSISTITTTYVSTAKLAGSSIVAVPSGSSILGTGLSGVLAGGSLPVAPSMDLVTPERAQRPSKASVAEAEEGTKVLSFAAAGAGFRNRATHHMQQWAFRGLTPWSDPT
ncbi:hypothetical protein [Streptomyces sp. NPDC050560]|uniref:hypothetical protein n=1 Tax=Streptomyces sp. NPDC050560 TaxID=3365630 RepID=UPI0037B5FE98